MLGMYAATPQPVHSPITTVLCIKFPQICPNLEVCILLIQSPLSTFWITPLFILLSHISEVPFSGPTYTKLLRTVVCVECVQTF